MSKLVAFAAIQGAYNIVSKTEGKFKRALETYGGAQKLEFPNTAYYLPIIYSLTGIKVTDLDSARSLPISSRRLFAWSRCSRIISRKYSAPNTLSSNRNREGTVLWQWEQA